MREHNREVIIEVLSNRSSDFSKIDFDKIQNIEFLIDENGNFVISHCTQLPFHFDDDTIAPINNLGSNISCIQRQILNPYTMKILRLLSHDFKTNLLYREKYSDYVLNVIVTYKFKGE